MGTKAFVGASKFSGRGLQEGEDPCCEPPLLPASILFVELRQQQQQQQQQAVAAFILLVLPLASAFRAGASCRARMGNVLSPFFF